MVTMRIFCYLLVFLILQLHSKASNANFSSQVPQAAKSEGLEASTNTHFVSKVSENVIVNRKTLTHVNVNVEVNEKNGFKVESKAKIVKKRKNKKRLTKTVSLTADYTDPGHHPPRHN